MKNPVPPCIAHAITEGFIGDTINDSYVRELEGKLEKAERSAEFLAALVASRRQQSCLGHKKFTDLQA